MVQEAPADDEIKAGIRKGNGLGWSLEPVIGIALEHLVRNVNPSNLEVWIELGDKPDSASDIQHGVRVFPISELNAFQHPGHNAAMVQESRAGIALRIPLRHVVLHQLLIGRLTECHQKVAQLGDVPGVSMDYRETCVASTGRGDCHRNHGDGDKEHPAA